VELKLPARFTEGDRPHLILRVHNLTGEAGTAEVKIRVGAALLRE
jgi:uncharacterized protein YfaS (alpha-2-macroglobulin family)